MFIAPANRMSDMAAAHAAMRAYDFAVLVTATPGETFATHVPLFLDASEGEFGTLYGHVARANPHGAALDGEHIAIFSGPHAYISPTWRTRPEASVPTWNYIAVHAHGRGETLRGADAETVLARMAAHYEPARDWTLGSLAADYKAKQLAAITAFKMKITRLDAKAKLDQTKPAAERLAAAAALEARGETMMAKLMREVAA